MIKLQIIIFGCFLFHIIISSIRLHSTPAASFTLTTAKHVITNRVGKRICSHQLLMVSTDVFSQSSKSSSSASSEHFPNNNTSNDNNGHNSDFSSDPNQQRFPQSSILNDSTEIMRKNNWKIVPDIWDTLAKKIPNQIMLIDEIHTTGSTADGRNTPLSVSLTFAQANRRIVQGATTLQQKLGILPGDCIAMFAENSYRWFLLDQSIMKTGACNAVREISAPTDELHYIYKNSRSVGMVLENCKMLSNLFQNYSLRGKMLKSPADDYPLPKFVIVLYSQGMSGKEMYEKYIIHNNTNTNSDTNRSGDSGSGTNNNSYGHTLKFIKENDIKLLSYEEFEEMGSDETIINNYSISNTTTKPRIINEFRPIVRDGGSTATVVYTSGTNSRPKGVLLRHRNLMYQILENSLVSDDSVYVVPVNVPTLIPPNLIPPALTSWGVKYVFFKKLWVNVMNALWMQWRSIRKTLSNPNTPITIYNGAPTATANTATTAPTTSLSATITSASVTTSTVNPQIGDVFVSVLPCWHIFERTCEYLALARGSTLVYSNLKHFKKDIIRKRPHLLIVVPRLLESIQKGIISNLTQQKGFNKQLIEVATKITDLYHHCHKIYSNRYLSDHKPLLIQRILFGIFTLLIYPFFLLSDKLVWSKIRLGLGGRIKAIVSGGASLPLEIDLFFERIGVSLLNGYGMTETSPVIANRKVDYNVIGSVGTPVHQTSIKIIDPDSRECVPVGSGKSGLLYIKGPGLMAGYTINKNSNHINSNGNGNQATAHSNHQPLHIGNHHNNNHHQHTKISSVTAPVSNTSISTTSSLSSSATTAVTVGETLDREGYFNTGDLAKIDVATGCLVITGRCKDTIVLSNGENVTPEPIEERIVASSPLIDQVMLVGQDKKNLAVLIVINTKEWAIHCGGSGDSGSGIDGDSSGGSDIILTSDLKEPTTTTASSTDISSNGGTNRNQGTMLMTQQAARHQALKIDTKSLNDDPQLRQVIRNAIDQAQGFVTSSSSGSSSDSSSGSVISGSSTGTSAKQRAWERVSAFTLLSDPFTVENGLLTQTLKIKRSAVAERYQKEIQSMYNTNIIAAQQQ